MLGNPADVPPDDLVSKEDIVVVTIGYRLNAFGFLSFEDPLLPGNYGLWDQTMALQWIYENIENFGGNRNDITVMGHSAGAASVGFHLLSNISQPFIQRSIMMSGSMLAPWALQLNARENARILGNSKSKSPKDFMNLELSFQNSRYILNQDTSQRKVLSRFFCHLKSIFQYF